MFEKLIEELREDEKIKEAVSISLKQAEEYSTEYRWKQYQNGDISEKQCLKYASERYNRKLRRKLRQDIEGVEGIAKAPDLREIMIVCEFSPNHNVTCHADIYTDGRCERTQAKAGGYGYDKESSAIADALDKSDSVLKALYQYKDDQLAKGFTDFDTMATSGHNNRNIIGYGAGYSVLPYFEGAVGSECYWRIFEKMGFDMRADLSGKSCTFYYVFRRNL